MLYKILLVLGIAYIVRLIFNNWSQQEKIKQKPKPKKDDSNTVDAEYTVLDDDK